MSGTASFARPATLAACLEQIASAARTGRRPTLLAGGTDWVVERHMVPTGTVRRDAGTVIDVTAIPELRSIDRSTENEYRLGGGVTYAMLRSHPELSRDVPMLAAMAKDVGAVQIQTRGTLAGNLATGSPAADGVPVLAALGCIVELRSHDRGTRDVAIEDFYVGYRKSVMADDEMIAAVRFRVPGNVWMWRKVGTRAAQAIAKVALAATAQMDGGVVTRARFGMASVAPTTAFLSHVRHVLEGCAVTAIDGDRVREALAKDIAPIDDVRSTREYRMHVAQRLLERFVDVVRARGASAS